LKVFWTFFWTFLLVEMLTYVVSSMTPGSVFDVKMGAIMAVCVTILIFVVSAIIPNDPVEKH